MKVLNGECKVGDLVVNHKYYRPIYFGMIADIREDSVEILWLCSGQIISLCHTLDYPLLVSRFKEHEHDRV